MLPVERYECGNMVIKKILNNNAALVTKDGRDMIVMGRGICYNKKPGGIILDSFDITCFVQQDTDISTEFIDAIKNIPQLYFDVTAKILKLAHDSESNIDGRIFLTLLDHINFAVARYKNGMEIKNLMLWEVKRIYPHEFVVGMLAAGIIEEAIGVSLPEDEAAFIAMHLVSFGMEIAPTRTRVITETIYNIIKIISYEYGKDISNESLAYVRLVTHLKFIVQRVLDDSRPLPSDAFLYAPLSAQFPKACQCAQKISDYFSANFTHILSDDEKAYLIVHIQRVTGSQ